MLVQILTREEVKAFPTDEFSDFVLCEAPYDCFPKRRLKLCGKCAYAKVVYSTHGTTLYKLAPVNKEDESIFDWEDELFTQREFHCIEDPSRDPTPPTPMSFEDLMKNM